MGTVERFVEPDFFKIARPVEPREIRSWGLLHLQVDIDENPPGRYRLHRGL
jgi:hypothetical protein